MMVILELAAAGIGYGIYKYWKDWREERKAAEEEECAPEDQTAGVERVEYKTNILTATENMGTRDLVLETLPKIGCQYTIEEESKRICFNFQGENFVIDADNECHYIQVWDLWWAQQDLNDIEGLSRMRRAINQANINSSTNIFYTVNKEEGIVGIHSRMGILFVPQIPNLEGYLQSSLAEFFSTHRLVARELDRIRVEERA